MTMKNTLFCLLSIAVVIVASSQLLNAQDRNIDRLRRRVLIQRNKPVRKRKVRFINPITLAKPPGYTHVVEVSGGRTVYIAGQIALDSSGNIIGRGDFRAQAEQVFANLKAALESVGGSWKDVIKLNMYVTDISQLGALREARDKYVNTATPPVSTLVEVRRLASEELMIEIEAVAVLPN